MKIVFDGKIPSKKNNKRISFRNNKPRFFSSQNFLDWEERELYRLKTVKKRFKGAVKAEMVLYVPDKRTRDLSNAWEGIADILVKACVILDDSVFILQDIRLKFGGVDKKNPRAIVELTDMI